MVMAAGVDAAGDLDLQLADRLLPPVLGEALGDALGDRDRAGVGERAIIEPGAGDDVGDQARVGGGEAGGGELIIDDLQVVARDVRQDEILLMADAHLVRANSAPRDLRPASSWPAAGIARHAADRLQRDRHDRVARNAMAADVVADPAVEARIGEPRALQRCARRRTLCIGRRREVGGDPAHLVLRQAQHAVADAIRTRPRSPR